MIERRDIAIVAALVAVFILASAVFLFFIPQGERIWPPVIDADEAEIYGTDNDYRNENVRIRLSIHNGSLRDVGDPNNGLAIDIYARGRDWGPVTADVRGKLDYAAGYVEKSGFWEIIDNNGIGWRLHVPVTQDGSFEEGESIDLFLWTDNNPYDDEYTKVYPENREYEFLDERVNLDLKVNCFDFGRSTDAYLYGTAISQ